MNMKVLIPTLLAGLVVLVLVLTYQRNQAQHALMTTTQLLDQLQGTKNTAASKEKANAVIAKVRKHMDIAATPEPTVATIVDVKKLQEKNAFYKNAENGDFLIVTSTRAILYSESKDVIIDVAPVQIQPSSSASSKK